MGALSKEVQVTVSGIAAMIDELNKKGMVTRCWRKELMHTCLQNLKEVCGELSRKERRQFIVSLRQARQIVGQVEGFHQ